MFVILAYDIGVKRVAKARKITKKYLNPVQKSVFEGHITEKALNRLKKELGKLVVPEQDSIVVYTTNFGTSVQKSELGRVTNNSESII